MAQDGATTDRSRRLWVYVLAAFLFVAVFALRVVDDNPTQAVTLLYALPIALLAAELGIRGGLGAAALALGLFAVWDLTLETDYDWSGIDYAVRGVAFFVIGAFVGALADSLRRISTERERFWNLSNDLLCVADFDGYFTRVNPTWESQLGWTEEELLGKPFVEFVHPDDRERTAQEAARLGTGSTKTVDFENRYRRRDGTYRTLLWSATPASEEGRIYATARDVTDHKVAEAAAEAARAEADRANRAKTEFLSRVSHELRTPLNSVLGFGQLLELEGLDERQREAVEQILKGGRHLLGLIDEVLDISRIEAGTMVMELEPVELASVAADALSLVRPLADNAAVKLLSEPDELADVYVLADAQRLKQVLINLLSNAIKYNRTGGEVRVSCPQPAGERVEIAVADTGRGVSADQLERLFAPFDRLGAERTEVEGTGLGLSLSVRLMEGMGGTMAVESRPGEGTTMRIQLQRASAVEPTSPADQDGRPEVVAPEHAERTIVYIEDNPSNLKLVGRALELLPGARMISALHGELGIELVREHVPDLVLLDLHLPDMHGREVLEHLKRDPRTAAVPVVVVTADATRTEVERLLAAGADSYLTKPISLAALLERVSRS